MAFATIQDVKDHAIFKSELSQLTDPQLTRLLKRSERMIVSMVGSSYAGETDEGILFDLNVVTVYMVDKLFIVSQTDVAENAITGMQTEKVLERTYTLSKEKLYVAQQFESEFAILIGALQKPNQRTMLNIFQVNKGASSRGAESCDSTLD